MLHALGNIGVLVFVVATMIALGLRLTLKQIVGPLRSGGLAAKALLASFVLVPALALAIRGVLPLGHAFGTGLILMATAAGAPFLPPVVQLARGDVAASVGVLMLLMGVSVLYLPLVLPLLVPGIQVSPLDIATSLVGLMLIPLAIGLLIHRRNARLAARLQRFASLLANAGVVIGGVALLTLHGRALLGAAGTGAFGASVILIVGAFLTGWLLAGTNAAARPVLALGTSLRNIPAALVVADLNFDDPDVLVMCIVVAFVTVVGLPIAACLLGRHVQAREHTT